MYMQVIQNWRYEHPILFIRGVCVYTSMQVVADSEGIFGLVEEVKADEGVYLVYVSFTRYCISKH